MTSFDKFVYWGKYNYLHAVFLLGVPAAKQARVAAPVPDLDSITLSQAQVDNPEMLFKVNHTAKYVVLFIPFS